ncbi:hypothetical protein HMPREF0080_01584 [Anaeroglobus geminatus F0357]|uniref:Uncharacterized protein n=1 Tax=Anaeroglobus geminatus F0357 TaxID=861450 RepID=G9YIT9_9FIRM|nr:hypothetical protein HMPREF0080_01584 [Anaeroglobus geminatus F0357]
MKKIQGSTHIAVTDCRYLFVIRPRIAISSFKDIISSSSGTGSK